MTYFCKGTGVAVVSFSSIYEDFDQEKWQNFIKVCHYLDFSHIF